MQTQNPPTSPRRRDRALYMLTRQYEVLTDRITRHGDTTETLEVIVQWQREASRNGATQAQIDKTRPKNPVSIG